MIEINQVSLQRGTKPLLEQASLRIHDGQRIALIGANGCGKSSLFALLQGQIEVDAGNISIPGKWRIAHMAQEVAASERSALDYTIDGDQDYRTIESGINQAHNDQELSEWVDRMDAHQGYEVPSKAERLLDGLGFSVADMTRPVKDFSGGWRIRLNLAQALMSPSDCLLLDEPTNHLDLEATLWLESWLKQYSGTLLFISHDRDFIDGVADHIVHLHLHQLTQYPGNYSAYERIRADKLAQQQSMFEKQQSRIAQIESFVSRFRAKATKARQAQSRIKELERMELILPAHVDSPFQFNFPCHDDTSSPLLRLADAKLGYANPVLNQVNLSIEPGDRIGILGTNGSGKSTLLKTLCGDLSMIEGDRTDGEHLKVGYYAQHQLESLDTSKTGADILQSLRPSASTQEVRNFLGGFGFHGERALEVIAPFSGGEKARLALACVAWQKPNLLIMDEPTNHLDIEMREALAFALQSFEGGILLVSHDRHLIKSTVDRFWLVAQGKVSEFDGDLSDYHQLQSQPDSQPSSVSPSASSSGVAGSSVSKKDRKRHEAEIRQKQAPLRKKLKSAESIIEKSQARLSDIESLMGDNSLYEDSRKQELQSLLHEQSQLQKAVEDAEAVWFEISEELEASGS
jgi:ATP-binding cassette subfamily F protein 3